MIDIIGTSLFGLVGLILFLNFMMKLNKRTNISKIILIILFLITAIAASFRIIYLIEGIENLNNVWKLLGITYSLGIFIIGMNLRFPNFEKINFYIFLTFLIIIPLSFFYNLEFLKQITPFFSVALIFTFAYLYLKYKFKKLLYYLLSMIIFMTSGIISSFFYTGFYFFNILAFLILYLAFKD